MIDGSISPAPLAGHTSPAAPDLASYPRPSLAVDVVLFTVLAGELWVLLVKRPEPPSQGQHVLPGGFVRLSESLDEAAARVLREKAGLEDIFIEQLYTFGEPGRDPRARVVSCAYFALLPPRALLVRSTAPVDRLIARVVVPWAGEQGGPVRLLDEQGAELALAFDHAAIIGAAVKRLRGKLWYAPVAFEMVPEHFSLGDLQLVYETILGRRLQKNTFRLRLRASGFLEETGQRRAGTGDSYRPPMLYRFVSPTSGARP
jgi:8-oxo-dGTP diphosphatase